MADRVTTGARIRQLMSERNLKQVEIVNLCKPFEKRFGVTITKSNISQWVNEKYIPDQLRLSVLSEAFRVSPAWLMGFDVPKELTDTSREEKKTEVFDWILREATKEERLELLKELAKDL